MVKRFGRDAVGPLKVASRDPASTGSVGHALAYALRRAAPSGVKVMFIAVRTDPEMRRRRIRSSRSSTYGLRTPGDHVELERSASHTRRASRRAMDRPWPITGSLQPAASPIRTAPGTTGPSVQASFIG